MGGEVSEVNEALAGNPALVNTEPYGNGWLFKLKDVASADADALMDAESVQKTDRGVAFWQYNERSGHPRVDASPLVPMDLQGNDDFWAD